MTFVFWILLLGAIVFGLISRLPIGYGARLPFIGVAFIWMTGAIIAGIIVLFKWIF